MVWSVWIVVFCCLCGMIPALALSKGKKRAPSTLAPTLLPTAALTDITESSGLVVLGTNNNLQNQITSLSTTIIVPALPQPNGTVFIWPGLEPGRTNFWPINLGVLQPVLSFGPSCAPGAQPPLYSSWWISGQYVNTFGSRPGFTGCLGGPIMVARVGDVLSLQIFKRLNVWKQRITNLSDQGKTVAFSINLGNQYQNWAIFRIEDYNGGAPVGNTFTFYNTSVQYANWDPSLCYIGQRGLLDSASNPVAVQRSCFIGSIKLTLR